VTQLLHEWRAGRAEALAQLMPHVYDELHRLAHRCMRGERAGHVLQTTALVHEAFVRLVGSDVSFHDRAHFFALSARQMRRILVDHARERATRKRGAGLAPVEIEETHGLVPAAPVDLLDLDRALSHLAQHDRRKAEAVELHFFGGMTHDEVAAVLDVSASTVRQELRVAKAWLASELGGGTGDAA
jgi:RNA polymerase sigma factor (TIGR02999 family)